MRITHGSVAASGGTTRSALTIGNFDGVHLGHQAMLARLKEAARRLGLPATVITFEPHPREFFTPAGAPARLTPMHIKLELLEAAGVDHAHVARFNAQFASLSPERFVAEVLVNGLGCAWLLAGRDFRYGAKRAGDFAALEAAAARHGFVLEAMPEILHAGERISSSAVRAALAAGDMQRAASHLGRPFALGGHVAHGDKLGRDLGFATANIPLGPGRAPLRGIFVVEALGVGTGVQGSKPWPGVASLGVRPTVKADGATVLEVHLFDFSDELYGRRLEVNFLAKLREEEKYEGLDALRAAIARDVARAKDYFATRRHG
ncbi:MAG: bifunctional riboflavin kinase/FAD synthetase [Betaproteobacteria bacterium]|nr:bifunctional riboflavin kinase/FAD synthetase [Betaproteobacteria bacterium]